MGGIDVSRLMAKERKFGDFGHGTMCNVDWSVYLSATTTKVLLTTINTLITTSRIADE